MQRSTLTVVRESETLNIVSDPLIFLKQVQKSSNFDLLTASQLQWDYAYVVISPDMQNNDRKTVFDT